VTPPPVQQPGTSGPDVPDPHAGDADGPTRFARIWCRAVYPETATSMTRAEFEEHLLELTRRLHRALHARPFSPAPGREVGAALVAAHCTTPDSLPRILGIIDAYLALYCADAGRLPAEEARNRCSRLQHAIAAGFAQSLR
jgi:hypothetical protein